MSFVTLTRKELYDLVWSEPMMHLASRYGLSDVGLAKICRKCDIPRPPRGYWAQKQVGKAPRQTQLPHPEEELGIELRDPNDCRIVSTVFQEEVVQKITEEKQIESKIEVADNLHGSHPLVSQVNQKLQIAKTDENGLIILPEKVALHIHVSKGSLRRSLLIMDALLKGLEQRGYQISKGPIVEILGVAVRFEISESLQTVRETPNRFRKIEQPPDDPTATHLVAVIDGHIYRRPVSMDFSLKW